MKTASAHTALDLTQLKEALVGGDADKSRRITEQALKEGFQPTQLVSEFMMPAMSDVGKRFKCHQFFVPELLLSARALKAALDLVRPLLVGSGAKPVARVVIGTVEGDLHDIGKNLVVAILEGAGFEVIDLGVNVTPQRFIGAIHEKSPQIIAMSALLTTTICKMKLTIDELKKAGLREKVKVLIGGGPITEEYANEIGADGYSENAVGAAAAAEDALER